MSLPSIPGLKADHIMTVQFRREVANLLKRDSIHFPGAQPVSFAHRHLDELRQEDYYVCEKSDGIRCLLYCAIDETGKEIHYLIDRKNDYYYVPNLHLPKFEDPSFQSFLMDTLVDGELVLDDFGNGKTTLRYLVFDCLVLDGLHLMHRTLDKRLAYFKERVFEPYKKLCKAFPSEIQYFPFLIEFKPMQFSYGIEMMFKDIIPKLKHGNDGLIFTARNSNYKFGTDEKILKWKPAEENSIDFRLSLDFPFLDESFSDDDENDGDSSMLDYDAKPTFVLSVNMGGQKYERWAEMYMEDKEWDDMKAMNVELQETIVECALDEQKRWRFMRFRNDKKEGNHISTVNSVLDSIKDAVSRDDLIAAAKSIRKAWKAREEVQRAARYEVKRAWEAQQREKATRSS